MKKELATQNAPAAVGAYSQAVFAGGFLFVSGQVPLVPSTGEVVGADIKDQSKQVMENLQAILKEAGLTFDDAVKLTVYLTDISNFAVFNEIYASYFNRPYPARAVVEVGNLPKGVMVEADLIAVVRD